MYGLDAVVTYTCVAGMSFQDGTTITNITCQQTGQWSQIVSDCKGRLLAKHCRVNISFFTKSVMKFIQILTLSQKDLSGSCVHVV